MFIVTTPQMQAAERAADAAGISFARLMENAGQAIATAIETEFEVAGASVLILVGPGNNGGDGLVVARHLAHSGADVTVYVWKRNLSGDENWARLTNTAVALVFADDDPDLDFLSHLLTDAAIIVDALLGTGASRPIGGLLADILTAAKTVVTARRSTPPTGPLLHPTRPVDADDLGPLVVAVDVPTGLNSDTGAIDPFTLPADMTVTLAAVKLGHILPPGPTVVGQLVVGDIGLTPAHYPADVRLQLVTAADVTAMLPPRPATAHKGTFGTAVIAAGSMNYLGAVMLAGQAALRSGAGLVTIAPPQPIYPIVAARLAEATYLPLPDSGGYLSGEAASTLRQNLGKATALLVGPGLAHNPTTTAFVTGLLASTEPLPPLVLDADALNILSTQVDWWRQVPAGSIITPHPAEMARLMGVDTATVQAHRLDVAAQMAEKWQVVVLLKGAYTVVCAPDGRTMVLPFANPALAKGGSGDVLAGVIVALRAQGLPPFEAAVAGAYLHGLAGEFARENVGAMAATAGDLADLLPLAVRAVYPR